MTLRKILRYGVIIFASLFMSFFVLSTCASGQSLEIDYGMDVSVWSAQQSCYQHTMDAGFEAEGQASIFFGEAFASFKWWGSCDSKIPSSFMNAESTRAITRKHGANAGIEYRGVQLGATIRRRADQIVWRHAENHRGFPRDNSVTGAIERCNAPDEIELTYLMRSGHSTRTVTTMVERDMPCPGIGYWDGVRPYLGFERAGLDVSLVGPNWTWKDLTLPHPDWIAELSFERGVWSASAYGQAGGLDENAGYVQLSRVVIEPLRLGIRGGRAATPGWKNYGADFLAVVLTLDSSWATGN